MAVTRRNSCSVVHGDGATCLAVNGRSSRRAIGADDVGNATHLDIVRSKQTYMTSSAKYLPLQVQVAGACVE